MTIQPQEHQKNRNAFNASMNVLANDSSIDQILFPLLLEMELHLQIGYENELFILGNRKETASHILQSDLSSKHRDIRLG